MRRLRGTAHEPMGQVAFDEGLQLEDALFGILLKGCFKGIFLGLLPHYMLLHDPLEKRHMIRTEEYLHRSRNPIMDLFWRLIQGHGTSPTHALAAYGAQLVDLSTASDAAFISHLTRLAYGRIIADIEVAQGCLDEHPNHPAFWRRDVVQYMVTMQDLIQTGDFIAMIKDTRTVGLWKTMLAHWGNLLLHWPILYQVAAEVDIDDFAKAF